MGWCTLLLRLSIWVGAIGVTATGSLYSGAGEKALVKTLIKGVLAREKCIIDLQGSLTHIVFRSQSGIARQQELLRSLPSPQGLPRDFQPRSSSIPERSLFQVRFLLAEEGRTGWRVGGGKIGQRRGNLLY